MIFLPLRFSEVPLDFHFFHFEPTCFIRTWYLVSDEPPSLAGFRQEILADFAFSDFVGERRSRTTVGGPAFGPNGSFDFTFPVPVSDTASLPRALLDVS